MARDNDDHVESIEEDLTFKIFVDKYDAYVTLGNVTIFNMHDRWVWDNDLKESRQGTLEEVKDRLIYNFQYYFQQMLEQVL